MSSSPDEPQHEYEEVLRQISRVLFQPHDAIEDSLVVRSAQAHWRSLRSCRVETGMLHIAAATVQPREAIVENCPEDLNTHNAIAVGFLVDPSDRWQKYLRYDTTIARDFFRTLDALKPCQRPSASAGTTP